MELVVNKDLVIPALGRALCYLIDAGKGNGVLELYEERGGKLLATLKFPKPCSKDFGVDAVVFKNFAAEDSAPNRGHVQWAKVKDSDGNLIFECDAGGEKDNVVVKLDEPNIRRGDIVRLKEFVLRLKQVQKK